MAKIYVDIGNAKNETNSALPRAKNEVSNISSSVTSVRRNINYKVQNKRNISGRLNNVSNELSAIASKLQDLYYGANRYLDSYNYTEERIVAGQFSDRGRSKSANELAFDSIKNNDKKAVTELLKDILRILGITSLSANGANGSLISLLLKKITNSIINLTNSDNNKSGTIIKDKSIFDVFSNLFTISEKGTDKLFDLLKLDNDATRYTGSALDFGGNIVDYIESLYKMFTGEYKNVSDATAGWLSLFDKSTKVETGLYKFFENVLHPYQASKLYDKFNGGMTGLNIAGSLAGFLKEGLKSRDVFSDENSKWYEKTGQLIDFWGSGIKTIGNVYISTDCSSKVLQFVSKSKGNQILAEKLPELSFSSAKEIAKKAKTARTYLALADVGFSTISGGVRKYGECMEDGKFTWGDAGSVGLASSCDGLSAVGRGLTFGIVDVDGKAMADYLEYKADEFARGDSWAAKYIRDENNNIVFRFGVSVGSGAYIVGKEAYGGLKEGCKIIGGWVSSAWNKIF